MRRCRVPGCNQSRLCEVRGGRAACVPNHRLAVVRVQATEFRAAPRWADEGGELVRSEGCLGRVFDAIRLRFRKSHSMAKLGAPLASSLAGANAAAAVSATCLLPARGGSGGRGGEPEGG